jgi:hypothetical protein
VSAQNAKDAADDFVAKLRLSADAKGRKFQLVTFTSEVDCRFFYPRRSLDWQRQVNTYISRALRERFGVRVERVSLTPADFQARFDAWTRSPAVSSSAAPSKREFADQHLKLL